MDCHIETFMERAWRARAEHYRASVIHTASGRVLHVTWPYRSEHAARQRAGRWIREQYRQAESLELFDKLDESAKSP